MATKKPTTKSKKSNTKAKAKRPIHLYRERNPECHTISGKYTFFYIFFAFSTLVFALTTIYLYSVTHDIVQRYDDFVNYSKENSNKYEGEVEENE